MRSSASFRRACSRLSFLFVLLGCGEPPTEVLDLQVRADVETRSLPELAPPFASAEIEAMVETFDWADTEVLPELDEDGRPALYYALVLLRDRSELEELGTHEIHHDALPLFEVEHARWDGQIGTHAFPGSDVGDFAFALIPAEVINLYRQAALDGEPIFRAVILREVPVPEARLPGGSVDYDWLGAQGFVYGGTTAYAGVSRDEAVGAREDELDGVGRSEAALAGRVVRAARRLVRRVINGVRQVASEVRQALGGDRRFGLRLFVHETDADFDLGPDALMRQAWLGGRGGQPIQVKGVEVLVASGAMISLDRGFTDRNGFVHFRIPTANRIRVHLRLKNAAADVIGVLWDKRITVFHGRVDRNAPVHVDAHVQDADMNVLAQLTSARDFVHQALDYESPRRVRSRLPVFTRTMPTALVRTGQISRIAPNAFAPCLGFYGFGTFSFGHGRGWTVAANAFSILDEADIWLPEGDARVSRVVPTHEYGHYVMCAFLADQGRRAFGRAYGEVWQDSLFEDGSHDGQAGILAEAWADFLSSQIAGGYGYFEFDRISDEKDTEGEYGDSYCQPVVGLVVDPCLEDNIGGPSGAFPRGQDVRTNWLDDPRDEDIARFATLFTDAFDGGGELHNGAVWAMTRDPLTNDIVDIDWQVGGHADDESVILRGAALHAIVDQWATTSHRLRYGPFVRAMARTMWLEGEEPDEICELFALHSPSGHCEDYIPELAGPYAPSTPTQLVAHAVHSVPTERPHVLLTWNDVSYAATGFELTGRSTDDDSFALERELPYLRLQFVDLPEVPFDRALRFEVVTRNETRVSAPATVDVWTPPEPARGLAGTALPGGVQLRWDAVEAHAVRIRMLAPEVADVATLPIDEATEHVLDGLAGDTDYTFEIVTVGGAGEVSGFPSEPLTIRTLPAPELYVAPFGDDGHPRAGTRLTPFATIGAALRASDASRPVTLRLAAGLYRERALRIADRAVTIEGGYDASWRRGSGRSVLSVASGGDLEPLTAPRFNAARRRARAALIAERATLTLDAIELTVSDASTSACVAGVAAYASDVRVRGAHVGSAITGPCRIALAAREGQLSILTSTLIATDAAVGPGSEHVALFTRGAAEVTVADSELFGIDARVAPPTAQVRGAFGWVDQSTGQVRITRTHASPAFGLGASLLAADVAGALDLTGARSIFVDNSVLQVPGGARSADVLRVVGADSVRLLLSTLVLGQQFVAVSRRATDRLSVVRLEGRVRSFTLLNDLFAFADWSRATPYAAIVDLSGLERASLVGSSVRGNVFSYPPADRVTANLGGGPLVMCDFAGEEFSVMALTESQLNQSASYTCRTGGTVVAHQNVALLSNPRTAPTTRSGVVLDDLGELDIGSSADASGTAPEVANLLRSGARLDTSLPLAELTRDRRGTTRPGAPLQPGVGAYVLSP